MGCDTKREVHECNNYGDDYVDYDELMIKDHLRGCVEIKANAERI